MKIRYGVIKAFACLSVMLLFFTSCFIWESTAHAYINADTYRIEIVGNGTTYTKNVTIKAQRQQGDGNGNINWVCFTDGQLLFNNTGQGSYVNPGANQCTDSWSYFQWDITGLDGNVQYGLKTVYIKLYYSPDVLDYTSRSVVYSAQPAPSPSPTPTPSPTKTPITTKTITQPTQPSSVTQTPQPSPTATPNPEVKEPVLPVIVSTEKASPSFETVLLLTGLILFIGLSIYQAIKIMRLKKPLNKKKVVKDR